MHLKTIAEKNCIGLIPFLLTRGKTVKSLHVIFEIIQAHKVSPQLKKMMNMDCNVSKTLSLWKRLSICALETLLPHL